MTKMKFVRFGGLSPVKQDHYQTGEDKPFHNPPCKRGIYAFPYPYVEKFLLGATDDPTNISHKTQWLKDENGNKIKYKDFYGDYDSKTDKITINPKYIRLLKKLGVKQDDIWTSTDSNNVSYVTVMKKPRVFEYDSEIWHHLSSHLKPHQIIGTSGSWVLSDMDNYLIALRLEIRVTKRQMLKSWTDISNMKNYLDKDPYKTMFAKDHLEVFIEKI